jgi:uncharacterized protein YcbK (DUF882 family)
MSVWTDNPYFKPKEFDSRDDPGSGEREMREDFIKRLTDARAIAGIPFVITSGFRTAAHNKKVGGVPNSAHRKGCAADIACNTDGARWIIVDALIRAGFNRIGIAKNFIHVDNDQGKNANRIWVY